MKTKLTILTLLIGCFALQAQTVTNHAFRVTTTVVNIGVSTNQSGQTTYNVNADQNNKDRIVSEGLSWEYAKARANGETNEFSFWLARVWIKDKAKAVADDKNRADSVQILEKLTRLLQIDIDLLTPSELSTLATIASKSP